MLAKGNYRRDTGWVTASVNVDFVRSLFAAWERGDFSSASWAHPEIEFVLADGPDPGSWTGVPAMAAAWRSRLEGGEDFRVRPAEYVEVDDERVLVLVRVSGRGKVSGVALDRVSGAAANLFQVRDGKVIRIVNYFDSDRAFAHLGLAPEADSSSP